MYAYIHNICKNTGEGAGHQAVRGYRVGQLCATLWQPSALLAVETAPPPQAPSCSSSIGVAPSGALSHAAKGCVFLNS